MKSDAILVVGGGLAGSFVAARLVQMGATVQLLDDQRPGAASAVAAGLFNTVTGQRAARTWMADAFTHALFSFLAEPPFAPLAQFCQRMPIYRAFRSPADYNDWCGRASLQDVAQGQPGYFEPVSKPYRPEVVHNPLGGLWVHGLGWMNVPPFLHMLHQLLAETGRFEVSAAPFQHSELEPGDAIRWQGQQWQAVVFAEGVGVNQNPFYPARRLEPLKGQILTVEIPGLGLDAILTGGLYLIPLGADRYVLGSTYEKQFAHPDPTPEGEAELLRDLAELIPSLPATVVAHRAGLRPTTPDRRPLLGRHPQYPGVWFFNGLGTKGILQAPYFSQLLAKSLLESAPCWPREVDMGRKCFQV